MNNQYLDILNQKCKSAKNLLVETFFINRAVKPRPL